MLYHLIASCCCLLWLTSYKYTFARTISNTYVLKKSLNHLSYRLQSLWSSFIFLKVFSSSSSSLSNCILFCLYVHIVGSTMDFRDHLKNFFSPGLSSSILCCFWWSNNQEMIKRDRQETEIQKSLRVFLG